MIYQTFFKQTNKQVINPATIKITPTKIPNLNPLNNMLASIDITFDIY